MKLLVSMAGFALLLSFACAANAQAIFPHSYEFHCEGQDNVGHIVAESGTIEFTGTATAIGFTQVNLSNGAISFRESFTGSFTNGTANPLGVGGNLIPRGCFTGALTLGGDTFGVNSAFFGCYNESTHGFSWAETAGSIVCKGSEM